MATTRRKISKVTTIGSYPVKVFPEPIISERAPLANDRAEIGQVWIDQPNDDIYFLTSVIANVSTWINAGGGTGTFHALTVTTTAAIGTTLLVGTGITLTAGTLTLGAMVADGVLTNTAAGVVTSNALTDGQMLIGSTGAPPVAATLTAGAGIAIGNAAGAITVTATGATAVQYTADDANTVVPDGVGNVNILGGTNLGSTAAIANTVTINLDAAPTLAGLLTCQLGIDVSGADAVLTSATNAGQDIYLHANGGVAETIEIYADQGTGTAGAASIYMHSDDGGITIDSGIAAADAIVINASDAVGGIDMDCGSGGFDLLSGGAVSIGAVAASDFTVTGASLDLTLLSTGGSVIVQGTEAVATAVQLTASDAAGGITATVGTGGLTVNSTNGAITLNSGTGAIDIGTDAAAHIVTLGNQNTTSQTIIYSGTGDIVLNSTDDITVDATGLFSIDSTETSNITVTGASEDLQLYSVGGAVLIDGSEAIATAISLDASDGAGGVTIAAGTGGLLFGNQADCTTIDIGDFAPTANRTITVGGGTVITAATTDTIDIGPDGATTNANSIKTVNINTGGVALGEVLTHIATGAITSGTHTVNIQSGNAAAGTVATNVSTGTGTKTVNVGNADGLTTVNIDAITLINDSINVNTSINTGTSTGVVAIGNAAAGAMSIDTAAGISLDAATASNFTVTGAADLTLQSTLGGVDIISGLAAADAIVINASDAAGGIDLDCGSAGFIATIANGPLTVTTGTGQVDISADATANTVNIATGAGIKTLTMGSDNTTSITTIDCGTAGMSLGTTANAHTTTVGSATGAASVVCQSGTGAAEFGANATDHTTTLGSVTGTSATTLQGGTGALNVTSTSGTMTLNAGVGTINVSNDASAATLNIGTGAAAKAVTLGSVDTTSSVLIQSGSGDVSVTSTDDITLGATGDLSLDGATVDLNATGGALSATPATGNVAGVALTIDARVFVATFTGQTTGAAADVDLDITNSFASAGCGVFVTVSNQGTNDADIMLEGCNTQTAGHIILHCQNVGAAALNGNITVTGWIIN